MSEMKIYILIAGLWRYFQGGPIATTTKMNSSPDTEKAPFACPKCDTTFTRKNYLTKHLAQMHSQDVFHASNPSPAREVSGTQNPAYTVLQKSRNGLKKYQDLRQQRGLQDHFQAGFLYAFVRLR